MSINRVSISGNLTRDPELRSTASGMAVLGFGVAVNDRRKNQQTGEWEDVPNFVDVTMFGNRAQAVSQYLAKGMKVAIDGRLRYSSWEKDGQKRSKLEVIAEEIEFMSRQGNGNGAMAQQPTNYPAQQQNGAYNAPQPAQMPPQQAAQYVAQQQAQMQQGVAQMQAANAQYAQITQPAQAVGLYDEDIPF